MREAVIIICIAFAAFLGGVMIGHNSKTADSEYDGFKMALRQSRANEIVMRRQLVNFDRIVRSTIIAVWVDSLGDTNMTMRTGDSATTLYRVRSR